MLGWVGAHVGIAVAAEEVRSEHQADDPGRFLGHGRAAFHEAANVPHAAGGGAAFAHELGQDVDVVVVVLRVPGFGDNFVAVVGGAAHKGVVAPQFGVESGDVQLVDGAFKGGGLNVALYVEGCVGDHAGLVFEHQHGLLDLGHAHQGNRPGVAAQEGAVHGEMVKASVQVRKKARQAAARYRIECSVAPGPKKAGLWILMADWSKNHVLVSGQILHTSDRWLPTMLTGPKTFCSRPWVTMASDR